MLFPLSGGADTANRDAIVGHAPDHVEVQHRDDVLARDGGVADEMLRAEQALLFGGEGNHQHAALESVAVLCEQAREFHNRRGARSVVVRAGVDVAGFRRERADLAVAQMVIVRPNHNHLVAQLRGRCPE
jgi:hypothetical protein